MRLPPAPVHGTDAPWNSADDGVPERSESEPDYRVPGEYAAAPGLGGVCCMSLSNRPADPALEPLPPLSEDVYTAILSDNHSAVCPVASGRVVCALGDRGTCRPPGKCAKTPSGGGGGRFRSARGAGSAGYSERGTPRFCGVLRKRSSCLRRPSQDRVRPEGLAASRPCAYSPAPIPTILSRGRTPVQ